MKDWLIIYDIRNPKRLAKIARIMEKYAVRVQKSVFEMCADEKTVAELRGRIRFILHSDDSLIIFNMCPKCWQKKRQIGVRSMGPDIEKGYLVL